MNANSIKVFAIIEKFIPWDSLSSSKQEEIEEFCTLRSILQIFFYQITDFIFHLSFLKVRGSMSLILEVPSLEPCSFSWYNLGHLLEEMYLSCKISSLLILQVKAEKRSMSLKAKLASINPLVENLRRKKEERITLFADIRSQIEKISREISGYGYSNNDEDNTISLDEEDLSLRKLAEYETRLRSLQREKVITLDAINYF